jgi:hypothetical protein
MSTTDRDRVTDGARIEAADIPEALMRAPFVYTDGATQVFTADGRTVYTENGRPSPGEWTVDAEGRFQSFWPPSEYTAYDLTWIVGAGGVAEGVRFTDPARGATFDGRYTSGRG